MAEFLQFPLKPLSLKAIRGFKDRTSRSRLRFPPGFIDAVDQRGDRFLHPQKDRRQLGGPLLAGANDGFQALLDEVEVSRVESGEVDAAA